MPSESQSRPTTIAIAALGGQGGGVLTNWIVDVAEHADYLVQATSVAGVAQRTGATIYGVELSPKALADQAGREPVFALYPVPGDVDIVIAAELAEAARAVERQFVTPELTTLIASTHRVYAMTEKVALGDGRSDSNVMLDAAQKSARKLVAFDMDHAAQQTGSVISSVLLGALAGSGALPFARTDYEDAIRRGGKAVEANLAGFAKGYENAGDDFSPEDLKTELIAGPDPRSPQARALVERIEAELPPQCQKMALEGARRCADYQDLRYANEYIDRLAGLIQSEAQPSDELIQEVARFLALRMCYEDTIRVADLKTRSARFDRFRNDVLAKEDQVVDVVEYLHPRIEEFCDTLPASLGRFVLRSRRAKALLKPFFGHGRNITTTTVPGFLLFHTLAKFRRWRRGTLRYQIERERIGAWLNKIEAAASQDPELALEIARCARLIKGYGDTYDRGLHSYGLILDFAEKSPSPDLSNRVARLREAALADESGGQLQNLLQEAS